MRLPHLGFEPLPCCRLGRPPLRARRTAPAPGDALATRAQDASAVVVGEVLGEVGAPTAVLVRPDGHVAWVGDGTDAGLREALTTWFGNEVL